MAYTVVIKFPTNILYSAVDLESLRTHHSGIKNLQLCNSIEFVQAKLYNKHLWSISVDVKYTYFCKLLQSSETSLLLKRQWKASTIKVSI